MANDPDIPTPPPSFLIDPQIAQNLIGHRLPDGWLLKEKPRKGFLGADETGGHFSVGYIAEKEGKEAFVKIFDLGAALMHNSGDVMKAMMSLGRNHQTEVALLTICEAAGLDRIVKVLSKGQDNITTPEGFYAPLPYIVFERAATDIRRALNKTNAIEDAWRFRMLHQVAVGVQQLHGQQIAHQDIKPSNVLIFEADDAGAKIGDLGRASRNDGQTAEHDGLTIAGDWNYAPPEQAYGVRAVEWRDRRESCDLYHLGALIAFLFAGVTPNMYYMRLPDSIRPRAWRGTWAGSYSEVVHHVDAAFAEYLLHIKADLPKWAANDMILMIGRMCDPNYMQRGDPDARKQAGSPLGIDRFISKLDRFALEASVRSKSA